MLTPIPTPVYRIVHIDSLRGILEANALIAPKLRPANDTSHRRIHNADLQSRRRRVAIPCGPKGTVHDYVPFYFGPRSPMLFQLHRGEVAGYEEGQEPIIYLVSSLQKVREHSIPFVFSDGHGNAAYTEWFDKEEDLAKVDWRTVYATYWQSTLDQPDRQRRKQAEFLVHERCPWQCVERIGVLNRKMQSAVESMFAEFDAAFGKQITIEAAWYY